MRAENLETRVMKRIARKRGDVFLRADFRDLGGYDQVGRVLRKLVRNGQLLKVGYGIYTRPITSPFSDKPVPPKGLATLTEALKRLGVEITQPGSSKTTMPGAQPRCRRARVVAVRGRIRRKLGYNGVSLSFERAARNLD